MDYIHKYLHNALVKEASKLSYTTGLIVGFISGAGTMFLIYLLTNILL